MRVTFLEKQFEKIDRKLDAIVADIGTLRSEQAYLKGRIEQLPTTLQLLFFIIAVLSVAGVTKYFAP